MKRELPRRLQRYLEDRSVAGDGRQKVRARAFLLGGILSFFLAIGAPYGNILVKGPYMAQNATTSGAFLLLVLLVGVLNLLFRLGAGRRDRAMLMALLGLGFYLVAWWPLHAFDIHSPRLIYSSFLVFLLVLNWALVLHGGSLTLNRSELILVYAMLLVVSAVCSLGLSEILLPGITALFYYASPENRWAERLFPLLPERRIMVDDGNQNRAFYESAGAGHSIAYEAWVEPLFWWGIFLGALYAALTSMAVILRRQWVERERLPYPVAQVPLALVRGEKGGSLVNHLFKSPAMWAGCALPLVVGSLRAWHMYDPAVVRPRVFWSFPVLDVELIIVQISFIWVGFCYFVNTKIAAGVCLFHLLFKLEGWALVFMGLRPDQTVTHGFSTVPLMGYQGAGAFMALVAAGLWMGREHLKAVARKALGRTPHIDDGDEILSYRKAAAGAVGGPVVMAGWLWLMGAPLWVAALFVAVVLCVFIGITRYVAEAGLVGMSSPMGAPELVAGILGSQLIGPTGVFCLSMGYAWTLNGTINLMTVLATGLKLVGEMDRSSRRRVLGAVVLALAIGVAGAFWIILHMAHEYGGINLRGSYFQNAPADIYNVALRNLEPRGVYWTGLGFYLGGAAAMLLLLWARMRFLWWPLHPLGFPVGMVIYYMWFSILVACLIKKLVLRYGGAAAYRRSQPFFLGLIVGHVLCNGAWIMVDSMTGMIRNIPLQM